MSRGISRLLAIGMIGAASGLAACQQEPVLGYCDTGDTCRYDLPERMLVRTYDGYFQSRHPGYTEIDFADTAEPVATVEPPAPAPTPAADSGSSVVNAAISASATPVIVSISN